MILKRLEIQGFKSFAKKTTIEFCDEITSIIGPNGSGKSNIVDAIRWVMGEQRIKPLRAGKMEDIIFSGTTEKKALGYAQVSITLDNASGIFKSGYDEICVTRRLFRQGQSEYYINKTACRLKDVQELFMDTGLGREGYSVIGQGQIESIVNNSPYERRLLIEEAAGIVKYKMRKQEAERNLERAQNNLYRITDILSELEGRLPALKRQSEKAEKYVAYKNELKELEVGIFVHRMDILKDELGKNQFGKSSVEESIKNIDEHISALDVKYRTLKTDTARYEEEITSVNSRLHELVSTYENSKAEIQLARIKIDNFTEAIAKAKSDIAQCEEHISVLLNEQEEVQAALVRDENELGVLEPGFTAKKKAAELLEEKYINIDRYISKVAENIEAQDLLLTQKQSELNDIASQTASNEYIIAKLEEQTAALKTRLSEVKETSDFQSESSAYLTSKNALAEMIKAKNDMSARADALKEKISEAFTRLQTDDARLKLLKGYEDARQGYNYSVRRILTEKTMFKGNIYGSVGELVSAEAKYSEAITKALGGAIESVVVDNEQTAAECIRALKQNKWGRVTFLPLNIVRGSKLTDKQVFVNLEGYVATADELVKYDGRFKDAVESLLARTVVADTLDHASKIAAKTNHRAKIVTLDGEVLLPGGAITGGNAKNNDEGALKRKNDIAALEKSIVAQQKVYDALLEEKQDLKRDASELEQKYNACAGTYEKLKESELAKEQKIRMVESERGKLADEISAYGMQKKEAADAVSVLVARKGVSTAQIDEIKIQIAALKTELSKASSGGYKDDYLKAINEKNEIEKAFIVLREKVMYRKEKLAEINTKYGNAVLSKKHLEDSVSASSAEIETLKLRLRAFSDIDNGYETTKAELEAGFSTLTAQKETSAAEFYKINDTIIALNKERGEVAEKLSRFDVAIGKTEVEITHLQNDMLEDYSLSYAEALKYRSDRIDVALNIDRINAIKEKIKHLGNINVDAPEEYKEVKSRFETMSAQKEDLLKSKEELTKIIEDVSSNMTRIFNKQFAVIQKEFDRVFKILFNGGEARLVLTEEDDHDSRGVEIVAQPPKTKQQNISALSGGEKSLTACALIFAILKIKPAPFCVMDEIDAALDDANVVKFCEYLNTISHENQIILVTHKKRTMEAAGSLYGVSVAADGITNVFSVKLSQIGEKGDYNAG